jgi:probable H4MPT-linked C1 transfer pathway protein
MPPTILGLDIGGANLKAATPDRRAVSVPFALWKQPDKLPAALAELAARFPEAEELAVTMTGELCDCFETRREGVSAIIKAVRSASGGRRIRVWSTDGGFVEPEEAERNHLKVASANWHALATYSTRYAPTHCALLIDVGSTTTDLVSIHHGVVAAVGFTDTDRLRSHELVYTGVKRTPVCAIGPGPLAAEFFATTRDVYIILGGLPEDPSDTDTADGRPATRPQALARLARMCCADADTMSEDEIVRFAREVRQAQLQTLWYAMREQHVEAGRPDQLRTVILAGVGEFLARALFEPPFPPPEQDPPPGFVSLNEALGPDVSACAPAFAVGVLATEAG